MATLYFLKKNKSFVKNGGDNKIKCDDVIYLLLKKNKETDILHLITNYK